MRINFEKGLGDSPALRIGSDKGPGDRQRCGSAPTRAWVISSVADELHSSLKAVANVADERQQGPGQFAGVADELQQELGPSKTLRMSVNKGWGNPRTLRMGFVIAPGIPERCG